MRRRRAILFDDDSTVLESLALLFEELGYDVLAFRDPNPCSAPHATPAYCGEQPCADILVTDLEMSGISGVELLQAQARGGCPLTSMNKAVVSGNLDDASREAIDALGCARFTKPLRFAHLEEWVRECEPRMNLSRPLGTLRRERREPCSTSCLITVDPETGEWPGEIVNRSYSGLCLRTVRQLQAEQVLDLRTRPTGLPERLVVRWTKPEQDGSYLAGVARV